MVCSVVMRRHGDIIHEPMIDDSPWVYLAINIHQYLATGPDTMPNTMMRKIHDADKCLNLVLRAICLTTT